MTELSRLLESSTSSNARSLLRAGMSEAAPVDFADRLRSGLALGAATAGAATSLKAATAGAATKLGSSSSTALIVGRWLALGALGGATLAGGTHWLATRHDPMKSGAPPARSASTAPPPAISSRAPAAVADEPPAAQPTPSVLASAPARSVSTTARTPTADEARGLEFRAIDRARRALAAGDLRSAFAELDEYERVAKTHVLKREAQVLRIEALYRAGNRTAAAKLSDQYLRDYPNDAHAGRVRALQDASQP